MSKNRTVHESVSDQMARKRAKKNLHKVNRILKESDSGRCQWRDFTDAMAFVKQGYSNTLRAIEIAHEENQKNEVINMEALVKSIMTDLEPINQEVIELSNSFSSKAKTLDGDITSIDELSDYLDMHTRVTSAIQNLSVIAAGDLATLIKSVKHSSKEEANEVKEDGSDAE